MSPLTWEQARGGAEHLSKLFDATIVDPGNTMAVVARAAIKGTRTLFPLVDTIAQGVEGALEVLDVDLEGRSMTLPIPPPVGTFIILAEAAMASPIAYWTTVLHEMVHRTQIIRVGNVQSVVDYLGSGDLRGLREAESCGCAMCFKYIATGRLDDISTTSVMQGSYHLPIPSKTFAQGVVGSLHATCQAGGIPPLKVAVEALSWLRKEAPESILVESYRTAP